ncbi:MAG: hypothetical protein N4A72_10445 [Bacteroidales bacterium]|jgi:hypothetical protein|nr:hypothetical protein [Bacteroidales bacterium]
MAGSITSKINWIRRVVDVANDPKVKAGLGVYGYNETKIDGFNGMFTNTYALIEKQKNELQDTHNVNAQFVDKRDSIDDKIKKDIRLCNIAFRNNTVLSRLIPGYYTISPYDKWREKGFIFYSGLKGEPEAINILTTYNFTEEVINQRIADIEEADRLHMLRDKESIESVEATLERDEALDRMIDECRKVVGLARLALGDDSPLLSKV